MNFQLGESAGRLPNGGPRLGDSPMKGVFAMEDLEKALLGKAANPVEVEPAMDTSAMSPLDAGARSLTLNPTLPLTLTLILGLGDRWWW